MLYSEQKKSESMVIYVDAEGLKCAPFGRTANSDTILSYDGVNPITTDKWHHITCSYLEERYVTGQAVVYNLADITTEVDLMRARQPQKFTKAITGTGERNPTSVQSVTFRTVVGNDYEGTTNMYGYFKDVRVWAEVRSDPDLYTYRVR